MHLGLGKQSNNLRNPGDIASIDRPSEPSHRSLHESVISQNSRKALFWTHTNHGRREAAEMNHGQVEQQLRIGPVFAQGIGVRPNALNPLPAPTISFGLAGINVALLNGGCGRRRLQECR